MDGGQGLGEGVVAASSFRTSYVPLNTQADFIAGMQVLLGLSVIVPCTVTVRTSPFT